jgi:ArsR family transcriptional regulator
MNIQTGISPDDMKAAAGRASDFLRAISHPQRLLLLCQLSQGEKSVGDLALLLDIRQSTLSQHLARLKADDLVQARREGNMMFYSLASAEVLPVIETLYEVFCKGQAQ